MGKEEETPCTPVICCGVTIINFVVLRCRKVLFVKIAILVLIRCHSEQSYLGVSKGERTKKYLRSGIWFYHGKQQLQPNEIWKG